MCPDDTATVGRWAVVGLVKRFGFVAVLVGQIVYKLVSRPKFVSADLCVLVRLLLAGENGQGGGSCFMH
jgi:hypothetical protein